MLLRMPPDWSPMAALDAEPVAQAHSAALVAEHRYLTGLARRLRYDVSMRELILTNPHSTNPRHDWEVVETHRLGELRRRDRRYRAEHLPRARAFYIDLGFQQVQL